MKFFLNAKLWPCPWIGWKRLKNAATVSPGAFAQIVEKRTISQGIVGTRSDTKRRVTGRLQGGDMMATADPEKGVSRKRILVVDDDECIRYVVLKMVSVMGYDAVGAQNGAEALRLLLGDSFDLVITDLQMPGMDGLSLARRIKDKSPKMPVLLITGDAQDALAEALKKSCVDSAVYKPFTLEDLQESMRQMLRIRKSVQVGTRGFRWIL
jgi:CheY-like chemotaxis protein